FRLAEDSKLNANWEATQVISGHMELIYQICVNIRMYNSKDELLEKDAELSSTRVPYEEVTF
ncbi:hypothetical protein GIB67_031816, partial [Kingdonia uniflora]